MGVVIEICAKYPGGPTRMTVTDVRKQLQYSKVDAVEQRYMVNSGVGGTEDRNLGIEVYW